MIGRGKLLMISPEVRTLKLPNFIQKSAVPITWTIWSPAVRKY